MIITVLLWGAVGAGSFCRDRNSVWESAYRSTFRGAEAESPAVKKWPSKVKYFVTQFFGTQV